MRIEVIGPVYPYRGGIAHHTAQLALALKRAGHQATVTSFRRQYPAWLYPGVSDRDPSARPPKIDAVYSLDPLYPWTWEGTRQRLRREPLDLVVIQWWTTFWGPAMAYLGRRMRSQGVPRVFLIHNVIPHEVRSWDPWLARLALGSGSAFIVQSQKEGERLTALIPGAEIIPCPLPLYTIFDLVRIPSQEARKALSLDPDLPTLLFFGIVRPYKGLRDLLQACKLLQDHGPRFQLVVAGEFWETKANYEADIERLGLHGWVHLLERYIPNEEVPTIFSAADVFVAPYTAGTQSAAVTSALSYGLPVVVSESIADSAAGRGLGDLVHIVPPGNPERLAEGIQKALQTSKETPGNLARIADESWHTLVEALLSVARSGAGGHVT